MVEINYGLDLPHKDELLRSVEPDVCPVDVAISVAGIVSSDDVAQTVREDLEALADSVRSNDVAEVIDRLKSQGFPSDLNRLSEIDKNRIDVVLRQKSGNPITLAMILAGVANQIDLDCVGINFPQHFLVRIDRKLIDPLHMRIVTPTEMRAWAKRRGIDRRSLFSRATNRDIAIRMLNNVRLALGNQDRHVDALRVLDYKALLAVDSPEVLVEKSEVWLDLGDAGMAKELLEEALKLIDSSSFQEMVRKRIQLLSRLDVEIN